MAFFLVLILVSGGYPSLFAQFRPVQGDDPLVKAVFWGPTETRAWIYYRGQRFHVVPGMKLDSEWRVEEIRRSSILFRRTSTRTFLEIPINRKLNCHFHRECSFIGNPIGLWEAIELVSRGFGFNAVMHFQAGGSVMPECHAESLVRMLPRFLPPGHRSTLSGPVLLVFPVQPAGERWGEVLKRLNKCDPERLAVRFPKLLKPGSVFSRGDDIQFVLRQISLGGEVPVQFPRDLHFPVYASFRNVPFCQILVKVVYANQCFLVEREEGLEIQPWPRQILPISRPPIDQMIFVDPFEPQPGWGPHPPPELMVGPGAGGWTKLPDTAEPPPSVIQEGQDAE